MCQGTSRAIQKPLRTNRQISVQEKGRNAKSLEDFKFHFRQEQRHILLPPSAPVCIDPNRPVGIQAKFTQKLRSRKPEFAFMSHRAALVPNSESFL